MATPSVPQAQETAPSSPPPAAPPHSRRAARKAAFAAAVSTSLEWYDFFIYATAAALVFNKTFFATGSEVVAALNSFATVAVGFVARPIGGIVSGHFGDKYGRKPVLVTAILLMGVATTLIGFVPNTSITWLAPAMLVLLRICQGLAVGAQWGGAVLLATEYAPAHRRGFYGSFAQLGIPIGVVMGNAVFLAVAWAVSPEAFTSWGWRVPFWISLFMLFVAFAIHRYLEETPEFQQVEAKLAAAPAQRRSPVLEVLRHNSGTVLMAGGTYLVGIVMFYITITGSVQVATTNLGITRSDVLAIILIAAGVLVPMVPLTAYLSDRYGRKLIYGIGIVGMGLWAVPMWLLIGASSSEDIWPLAVALIVSCVVMSFQTGPQAALFAELFPPEIRYSGASLGYQAASILGGMAPMAMVALINGEVANLWRVGLLIAALSVLALACLVALARRRA
ncbi:MULTISPECIES: MFS transporter [Rhodococcus]|uniref:MHS family MFS transporter n=1 Tax=Rhodococcus aetherivorans TaxID=191292 RepID=A0AA46NVA5_9NOCA|nr:MULTISPECIES: MFS transporter [Rhodococcus]MBC2590520.1 MHS family MFS transporter [Rhodococcus aetherivorans]QRI76575.1 MHS family MFS transporter [Rhodococcus aetherivorans]QSE59991.1 MHS family MFS transporter [Rhodococcus sp. PSBB066]QSE68703.1 MHS family MFS transporter [Rhodococcus sp. PSBB049]UYF94208.1 MHS family MFS transporter [Rhodococcus aetherivorans]